MDSTHDLASQHCGESFRRHDHLARHELSHGEAKYQCQVASCRMTFHRSDVLKRHERVHQPDSTKKRRRPRRGIIPPLRSGTTSNNAQFPQNNSEHDIDATSRGMSRSDLGTPLAINPLDFCFTHYVQMCAKRWPFIHHSRLQQAHLTKEKRLAIAALGGCVVPEYRSVSAAFFEDAQKSLLEAHGVDITSAVLDQLQNLDSQNVSALELVQIHMLVLEYALWHTDLAEIKQWATKLTFEYASVIIPKLIKHIQKFLKLEQGWQEWIYEEQLIRALWTFYCITQKAMNKLPCSISTLRSQQYLPLPRSDVLFSASDEQSWLKCYSELTIHRVGSDNTTLKTALEVIQSATPVDQQVLTSLTSMARHVVLVALLELYNSGLKYLTSLTHNESSPGIFIDTIQKVKLLWHQSPGELFFSSPPRSLDLQNVLLMNHLHIRSLLHRPTKQGIAQFWPNLCIAASIANEVLTPILERGAINVSARACWLTDTASKWYVVNMAQVMVDWACTLKSIGLEPLGQEMTCHVTLRDRLNAILDQQETNGTAKGEDEDGLEMLATGLRDAWSDILRCPAVKWYHPQTS